MKRTIMHQLEWTQVFRQRHLEVSISADGSQGAELVNFTCVEHGGDEGPRTIFQVYLTPEEAKSISNSFGDVAHEAEVRRDQQTAAGGRPRW